MKSRRKFIQQSGQLVIGAGLLGVMGCANNSSSSTEETAQEADNKMAKTLFEISLAQWSLNKGFFDGKYDPLDFASIAKNQFDINAIEYVNQFFADKAGDRKYLTEMKKRADDNGVKSLLIMVDNEGDLGGSDAKALKQAVENHYKWVEAAYFLGCHSIRVNAAGEGSRDEVARAAIDGLGALSEYAAKANLNVIVENHGGWSSDGGWLTKVIKGVNLPNCGTLPDFGNFCIEKVEGKCIEEYDRYQGVAEMMPLAKAVSAKSHDFDAEGNEIQTDYYKMMEIVMNAGYSGFVGIEYEGSKLSEEEGIMATKRLLEKVRAKLG